MAPLLLLFILFGIVYLSFIIIIYFNENGLRVIEVIYYNQCVILMARKSINGYK